VRFLIKALNSAGCPVDSRFFRCEICTAPVLGAFTLSEDQKEAYVSMCSNTIAPSNRVTRKARKNAVRVLTHELVHAFDYCRFNFDPSDCRHIACTEIRAANLSGDCHMANEWRRGNFNNSHKECVKRRTLISMTGQRCPEPIARSALYEVFDKCYQDVEPFGSIP